MIRIPNIGKIDVKESPTYFHEILMLDNKHVKEKYIEEFKVVPSLLYSVT